MPTENEKQLTAMQILYNRNQEIIDKLEFTSNPMQVEYRKALVSVNDDIDTELLATERQQLIDFHIECMKKGFEVDGSEWKELYLPKIKDIAEQYYNETYK